MGHTRSRQRTVRGGSLPRNKTGKSAVGKARRSGPSINLIMTGVVAVLALAIGIAVIVANRSETTTAATDGGHNLGQAASSSVTVVEYVDFQCPSCYSYYTNVTKELEADYAGRITWQIRNFPLSMHPLAIPAARAAEAAADQGKYADYFNQLYSTWPDWAVLSDGTPTSDESAAQQHFVQLAADLGLDVDRFTADQASAAVQERIDADQKAGEALGVTGTPTIFIDGERYTATGTSWADVDTSLRAAIDAALAES